MYYVENIAIQIYCHTYNIYLKKEDTLNITYELVKYSQLWP